MQCSICSESLVLLGTVPFDRNNAGVAIVDTTPMDYYKCSSCDFICCPEMLCWTPEQFAEKVYNAEYVKYDPDYLGTRPKNYAKMLREILPGRLPRLKHLDYGSGAGIMSKELQARHWNSSYYDPYSSPEKPTGAFNFITAIEVFEHSNNIDATIKDIKSMLDVRKGVVLFSTLFADEHTNIDWWYIGARNGHIGILSEKSMKLLAIRNGLFLSSLSVGVHCLQSSRNNLKDLSRG